MAAPKRRVVAVKIPRASRLAAALCGALPMTGIATALAGPAVVATGEGQIGNTPSSPALDRVHAPAFAPLTIPGIPALTPNVVLGRIFEAGGLLPPPPEMAFLEDRFHTPIFPANELDALISDFDNVDKVAPAIEPWLSETDHAAVSFAIDGTLPDTFAVAILLLDVANGSTPVAVDIDNIPTFSLPLEDFAKTDVAIDENELLTAVFTEVPAGGPPRVMAQTVDGVLGDLVDLFEVNDDAISPEVALLTPDGERLVIPFVDVTPPDDGKIQANFVDLDQPVPIVLPEFDVSTTPASFPNARPVVAADLVTGEFTISWDFTTGVSGDPANVRARRFDADGLPLGDDFQVNVPPVIGDDNAQGQSDVAYGPGGLSVIVWAGDGTTGDPDTDIFARVFLPDGSPIINPSFPLAAGQFLVNTGNTPGGPLSDRQDRPKVSFLPEPDAAGRPQFAVVWRDVGDATGADPNGTGTSYRCFSIDGLEEEVPIFADGFESGDTSSWSASVGD